MTPMITGVLMALSVMFVVMQLPGKKYWVGHLWVVDTIVFTGVFYLAITIRSTDIAISTTIAGIVFTMFLHLWKRLWCAIYR